MEGGSQAGSCIQCGIRDLRTASTRGHLPLCHPTLTCVVRLEPWWWHKVECAQAQWGGCFSVTSQGGSPEPWAGIGGPRMAPHMPKVRCLPPDQHVATCWPGAVVMTSVRCVHITTHYPKTGNQAACVVGALFKARLHTHEGHVQLLTWLECHLQPGLQSGCRILLPLTLMEYRCGCAL